MKFFLILTILFSNILLAYDIDQVLDLYRKDNDLSKKTKDESLGNLTVYTRDDIERMQAHNLSELLNSLRSFRYNTNLLGLPDIFHTDPAIYSSGVVKIFINNHEITSAFAGSGFFIYGNIDLGFVDHVEIYEGSTSSYVNSEPSIITIKLYSKDPQRELGVNVQSYIASRGSHHENISYSDASEDLKYYVYASHTKRNRVKHEHENHTLSRDSSDIHALMSVDYKNIKIDAEYIDHKIDPFLSLSMFATPTEGDIAYQLKRVSSSMTFLDDDSLSLSLSFIRIDESLNLNTDGTKWTDNPFKLFLAKDSLVATDIDDVYNVKLEKKFTYKDNNFIFGSEYVKKSLHDTVVYNTGVLDTTPTYVDNSILSFYVQDDYIFSSGQLLTASFKYNDYDSKSNVDKRYFSTYQVRLGYIVSSETSTFKAFASQMQLPTEQDVLTSVPNSKIEILNIRDISLEYSKHFYEHTFGISLEYIENENSQRVASQEDAKDFSDHYSGSLKYDYNFDAFNKVDSMVYLNKFHDPISTKSKLARGANIRFLNSWREFDIYNEANYYSLDDSPIEGVNYNIGVRYKYTQALIFSLKGTNIFDSASKSEYKYVEMNGIKPEMKSLYISPLDRTVTLGMEYSF